MDEKYIEFKKYKDDRQKSIMLETTRRDLDLSKHPYAENIPHYLFTWGKRQDVDWMELYFQWSFVTGFAFAIPLAHLKYGVNVTR